MFKVSRAGIGTTMAIILGAALFSAAQSLPVPNPVFDLGDEDPEGWHLPHGAGALIPLAVAGNRSLAIIGTGDEADANFWLSDTIPFKPNTVYQLCFHGRYVESLDEVEEAPLLHADAVTQSHFESVRGSLFTGTVFNNRDLPELTGHWQRFTSYFSTPPVIRPESGRLRFGQWNITGMAAFDAIEVVEAMPVYRRRGDVRLGAGERIEGTRYSFNAPFVEASANHSRPLDSFDCYFNQPRWVFAEGDWVVYHHRISELTQTAGEVEVEIGYYSGGTLAVEAGVDGENWVSVGTIRGRDALHAALPAELFPSRDIWVRLRAHHQDEPGQAPDVGGSLQVYGYRYQAELDHAPGDLAGATHFMVLTDTSDRVEVLVHDFGAAMPGANTARVEVGNPGSDAIEIVPRVTASTDAGLITDSVSDVFTLAPNTTESFDIVYDIPGIGEVELLMTLGEAAGWGAKTSLYVSPLFAHDYGACLPDSSEAVALWWASSGWKVSRTRPAPPDTSPAIRLQAARNEREAAQVILRPAEPLRSLRVNAQALTNASGDVLPASALEILRVKYVDIATPTDRLGASAPWPDPLPPIEAPLDLEADQNQPFWIRAYIPEDTPAGIYTGALHFEADGWQAAAPLEIEVFDFSLPDRMTCQTAFGFDGHTAERYHGVTDAEDRRLLAAMYAEVLSAHHISPYELGLKIIFPTLEYTWPYANPWKGGFYVENAEAQGGGMMRVTDDNPAGTVVAIYEERFDVPEQGVHVAFRHKTEAPAHEFMVVLLHYDALDNWMHGLNTHFVVTGDTTWQEHEHLVSQFPEGARRFALQINPTLYVEDGSTMGTVYLDELRLTDVASGKVMLEDDFAPYDEAELARITTPQFDWASWDAGMEHVLGTYHFNSFILRTPGLGFGAGWAQHDNVPGSLLGYSPGTPFYEAAFKAWYHEVQEHLRERGWLEKAFIYWFDEPVPDQYDFVMKYNLMMKEAAPDLQRKLTEKVAPELIGGPNLWCPISYEYDHEVAESRRAEGERFWWYVCTAPKAPYTTLFIDHPATEMRVWLWQTWQRDIEGILIWALNWWTSDAAYPDSLQNPYEDPMSWCHILGEIVPPGAKHAWGNGDGRFLYPPLAAADGNPDAPVLEPPVGSIRLDMLRDGIEDYEYMVILRTLLDEQASDLTEDELAAYRQLLEVPEEISASLTEFTWDPAPIEARREAIARTIVKLTAE